MSNLGRMSLIKTYRILQNASVTASNTSELLRKNQQITPSPKVKTFKFASRVTSKHDIYWNKWEPSQILSSVNESLVKSYLLIIYNLLKIRNSNRKLLTSCNVDTSWYYCWFFFILFCHNYSLVQSLYHGNDCFWVVFH